jgi:hypothetical protein
VFNRLFIKALVYALALPFFGCLFLGVVKGMEYDSYWVGIKVWFFCFIATAPIFIWVYRTPLKSLAKGNRL